MTIEGGPSDAPGETFPIRIVVPQPGKGKRPLATPVIRTQQRTGDGGRPNRTGRTAHGPCPAGWQRSCTGPTISGHPTQQECSTMTRPIAIFSSVIVAAALVLPSVGEAQASRRGGSDSGGGSS